MPIRPARPDELTTDLRSIATREATALGIRPDLVHRLIDAESAWNPKAGSTKGAQGLMQLMPATAKEMGVSDPFDPTENIRGGVKYLKAMLDRYKGDERLALAAYNAGPGAVDQAGGVPNFPETQDYVRRIQRVQPPAQAATSAPAPAPNGGRIRPARPSDDFTVPLFASDRTGAPPQPSFLRSAVDTYRSIAQGLDITTEQGRRNVAGGAGAIAATALMPELAVPAWIARALSVATPIAGAYSGGAAEAGIESLAKGEPPTPAHLNEVGVEQAAAEGVGQVGGRLVGAVGRRLIGSRVGRFAAEKLTTLRAATEAQVAAALDAAERGVAASKQAIAQRLDMRRPAVSASDTGRLTQAVVEGRAGKPTGPARRTFQRLGQAVGEAAETGPDLPIDTLEARLADLAEEVNLEVSHTPTLSMKGGELSPELSKQIMQRNPDLLTVLPPEHPLPGTLSRIREALVAARDERGGMAKFSQLHTMKEMLDEAVNFDRPAKRKAEQITKGFRNTLRDLMSSHEPYNQATAAYAAAHPIFNKGIVQQLGKVATDNPESLLTLIKGNQPTRLNMLFEALDEYAPKSGGAAEGQAAKSAIQHAWTYERLVKGGPAKLLDRIEKIDPEFLDTMYGDAAGKTILTNLRQIGQAWKDAEARGALAIESASEAVKAAKKPTVEELRFSKANLGKSDPASMLRDLGYLGLSVAAPSHAGNPITRVGAAARGIFHGPAVNDLIYWAAHSPKMTRFLVDQVLTGPKAGMALADVLRWAQGEDPTAEEPAGMPMASHVPTGRIRPPATPASTPPPQPRAAR